MFDLKAALLAIPVMTGLAVGAQAATTMTLAPLSPQVVSPGMVGAGASCKNPVVPARVIEPFVDYPLLAEERGDTGIAGVGIALATSGRPQRVWLVRSSRMALLDAAALQAARMSGYSAERQNCSSVAGNYLLEVEFSESSR